MKCSVNPFRCPRLHPLPARPFCSFSVFPFPGPVLSTLGGKAEAWLPTLCRQGPDLGPQAPDLEQLRKAAGLRGGGGLGRLVGARGASQPSPSLVAWASLPPSTPSTSRGVARGARARALREGIRNSEIKCISLGNAPHSADQIKRIKVQGGESCLEPRGEKQVQREEKQKRRREEQRVEQSSSSTAKLFFRIIPSFGSHHHQKKRKRKSLSDNPSPGQLRPTRPRVPVCTPGRILSATRSQAAGARMLAPLQLALTGSSPAGPFPSSSPFSPRPSPFLALWSRWRMGFFFFFWKSFWYNMEHHGLQFHTPRHIPPKATFFFFI